RLGSLEIDEQLDFCGLLNRQVGRLLALKYPAGIHADLTVHVPKATSVAHQATGNGELAILIDCRHRVADGQRSELFASAIEKWIAADHESACSQLGQGCKNGIEVTYGARIQHMELQPKGARGRLQLARYGFGIGDGGRVNEQCNASRRRYQLMQQLHPLRPYLRCQRCYARKITARSGQAGDKARGDWVIAGGKDDRNGCRRSLCASTAAGLFAAITVTWRRVRSATNAGS